MLKRMMLKYAPLSPPRFGEPYLPLERDHVKTKHVEENLGMVASLTQGPEVGAMGMGLRHQLQMTFCAEYASEPEHDFGTCATCAAVSDAVDAGLALGLLEASHKETVKPGQTRELSRVCLDAIRERLCSDDATDFALDYGYYYARTFDDPAFPTAFDVLRQVAARQGLREPTEMPRSSG